MPLRCLDNKAMRSSMLARLRAEQNAWVSDLATLAGGTSQRGAATQELGAAGPETDCRESHVIFAAPNNLDEVREKACTAMRQSEGSKADPSTLRNAGDLADASNGEGILESGGPTSDAVMAREEKMGRAGSKEARIAKLEEKCAASGRALAAQTRLLRALQEALRQRDVEAAVLQREAAHARREKNKALAQLAERTSPPQGAGTCGRCQQPIAAAPAAEESGESAKACPAQEAPVSTDGGISGGTASGLATKVVPAGASSVATPYGVVTAAESGDPGKGLVTGRAVAENGSNGGEEPPPPCPSCAEMRQVVEAALAEAAAYRDRCQQRMHRELETLQGEFAAAWQGATAQIDALQAKERALQVALEEAMSRLEMQRDDTNQLETHLAQHRSAEQQAKGEATAWQAAATKTEARLLAARAEIEGLRQALVDAGRRCDAAVAAEKARTDAAARAQLDQLQKVADSAHEQVREAQRRLEQGAEDRLVLQAQLNAAREEARTIRESTALLLEAHTHASTQKAQEAGRAEAIASPATSASILMSPTRQLEALSPITSTSREAPPLMTSREASSPDGQVGTPSPTGWRNTHTQGTSDDFHPRLAAAVVSKFSVLCQTEETPTIVCFNCGVGVDAGGSISELRKAARVPEMVEIILPGESGSTHQSGCGLGFGLGLGLAVGREGTVNAGGFSGDEGRGVEPGGREGMVEVGGHPSRAGAPSRDDAHESSRAVSGRSVGAKEGDKAAAKERAAERAGEGEMAATAPGEQAAAAEEDDARGAAAAQAAAAVAAAISARFAKEVSLLKAVLAEKDAEIQDLACEVEALQGRALVCERQHKGADEALATCALLQGILVNLHGRLRAHCEDVCVGGPTHDGPSTVSNASTRSLTMMAAFTSATVAAGMAPSNALLSDGDAVPEGRGAAAEVGDGEAGSLRWRGDGTLASAPQKESSEGKISEGGGSSFVQDGFQEKDVMLLPPHQQEAAWSCHQRQHSQHGQLQVGLPLLPHHVLTRRALALQAGAEEMAACLTARIRTLRRQLTIAHRGGGSGSIGELTAPPAAAPFLASAVLPLPLPPSSSLLSPSSQPPAQTPPLPSTSPAAMATALSLASMGATYVHLATAAAAEVQGAGIMAAADSVNHGHPVGVIRGQEGTSSAMGLPPRRQSGAGEQRSVNGRSTAAGPTGSASADDPAASPSLLGNGLGHKNGPHVAVESATQHEGAALSRLRQELEELAVCLHQAVLMCELELGQGGADAPGGVGYGGQPHDSGGYLMRCDQGDDRLLASDESSEREGGRRRAEDHGGEGASEGREGTAAPSGDVLAMAKGGEGVFQGSVAARGEAAQGVVGHHRIFTGRASGGVHDGVGVQGDSVAALVDTHPGLDATSHDDPEARRRRRALVTNALDKLHRLCRVARSLRAELATSRDAGAAAEARVAELTGTVAALKELHEGEMAGMERAHADELAGIKGRHEGDVASIRDAYEEKVEGTKRWHADEVAELRRRLGTAEEGLVAAAERWRAVESELVSMRVASVLAGISDCVGEDGPEGLVANDHLTVADRTAYDGAGWTPASMMDAPSAMGASWHGREGGAMGGLVDQAGQGDASTSVGGKGVRGVSGGRKLDASIPGATVVCRSVAVMTEAAWVSRPVLDAAVKGLAHVRTFFARSRAHGTRVLQQVLALDLCVRQLELLGQGTSSMPQLAADTAWAGDGEMAAAPDGGPRGPDRRGELVRDMGGTGPPQDAFGDLRGHVEGPHIQGGATGGLGEALLEGAGLPNLGPDEDDCWQMLAMAQREMRAFNEMRLDCLRQIKAANDWAADVLASARAWKSSCLDAVAKLASALRKSLRQHALAEAHVRNLCRSLEGNDAVDSIAALSRNDHTAGASRSSASLDEHATSASLVGHVDHVDATAWMSLDLASSSCVSLGESSTDVTVASINLTSDSTLHLSPSQSLPTALFDISTATEKDHASSPPAYEMQLLSHLVLETTPETGAGAQTDEMVSETGSEMLSETVSDAGIMPRPASEAGCLGSRPTSADNVSDLFVSASSRPSTADTPTDHDPELAVDPGQPPQPTTAMSFQDTRLAAALSTEQGHGGSRSRGSRDGSASPGTMWRDGTMFATTGGGVWRAQREHEASGTAGLNDPFNDSEAGNVVRKARPASQHDTTGSVPACVKIQPRATALPSSAQAITSTLPSPGRPGQARQAVSIFSRVVPLDEREKENWNTWGLREAPEGSAVASTTEQAAASAGTALHLVAKGDGPGPGGSIRVSGGLMTSPGSKETLQKKIVERHDVSLPPAGAQLLPRNVHPEPYREASQGPASHVAPRLVERATCSGGELLIKSSPSSSQMREKEFLDLEGMSQAGDGRPQKPLRRPLGALQVTAGHGSSRILTNR